MYRTVGHSKSSKASSSCSNAIVEPQVSGLLQDCRLSITAKKKMQQKKKAAEQKCKNAVSGLLQDCRLSTTAKKTKCSMQSAGRDRGHDRGNAGGASAGEVARRPDAASLEEVA